MPTSKKKELYIPIGVKMIAIVSLILVGSLGGMMFLATGNFGRTMERTLKDDTMNRAELLSQKIESDLRSFIDTGRILAASLETGIQTSASGTDDASASLDQVPDLIAAFILSEDEAGKPKIERAVHSSERLSTVGLAMPERVRLIEGHAAELEACFQGVAAILNLSPDFSYPMLGIAFPYAMKNQHKALSVMVLAMTMERLNEALASNELYVNYLVNADGLLIDHPDQKLALAGPVLKADPIVRDGLTSGVDLKQLTYRDGAGRPTLGSYKRFFDGRLIMVSTVPEAAALADVYRLQRVIILAAIMILCVAVLLLFFFSKTITGPVSKLMAGIRRIREGFYGELIPGSNRDEIGLMAGAFNEMSVGLVQREKYKSALGKFVNRDIVARVLRDEIQLGGELRQAAILFSDIRSFTAISERLSPHEVVEFLNEYMTTMVECVNARKGVVDKFIGDAIMAVFGVPDATGNDAGNSVGAALAMRRALEEFNKGRGGPRKPTIRIGVGINIGEVVAGQIGSTERMEYTCIGDAVNLASRIESLNKPFHTDILISEHCYEKVKGIFRVEPMRRIIVKGKEKPQQVYAVLGRVNDLTAPKSLDELRSRLGIEGVSLDAIDTDAAEEKYAAS
jgi:adenylate cyclase